MKLKKIQMYAIQNCQKLYCLSLLTEMRIGIFLEQNFITLYQITNDQLNEVQELNYLHSGPKGEAKLLQTSQDTSDSLLNALKDQFEKKRTLVNIHVKAILEFEKIIHESSNE